MAAQASSVGAVSKSAFAPTPTPIAGLDDEVSARIAADAQNRAVEVVGERTESSTTWALPNDQVRRDLNPAPVRVKAADGSWASIDLTLVASKGGWIPKSSPRPVTFSAGGRGPAVLFARQGRSLSLGWEGALPAPVIAGPTATYELDSSRELVLTARPDGFEQSVVIRERPAVGEKVPAVSLPLTLNGMDAATVSGGGVKFEATKTTGTGESRVKAGEDFLAIQAPIMYSAATDAKTGEHTQVSELAQKLVQDPKAGVDARLKLTPDAKFLTDPKTLFPVTIDPVISAVDAIGDTWVRNGDDEPHGTEDEINAGLWNDPSQNSSALIKFGDVQYHGNHVTNATLNLFNSFSGSCDSNWVGVYPISQDWDPATVVYQNSPDIVDDDHQLWRQLAHGFDDSCPGASESFDVTSTVRDWSWENLPNYGFAIYADTNGPEGRKSFCSLDVGTSGVCSDPDRVPTLSVTYNSYPWDPEQVAVSPTVTGTDGGTYVTSLTPSFEALIGNTDGMDVAVQGEVSYDPDYPDDGVGEVWFGAGAASTPGTLASVTVDTPLTSGKHYRYRVRGGVVDGDGGTDVGAWSDYDIFTVDTTYAADDVPVEAPDLSSDEAEPDEADTSGDDPTEIAPGVIDNEGNISQDCVMTGPSTGLCTEEIPPSNVVSDQGFHTASILPTPTVCDDPSTSAWKYLSRTEMCRLTGLGITTTRVSSSGVVTVTGGATFNVKNWIYTGSSLSPGLWSDQITMSAYAAWGKAVNLGVSGSASCGGACVRKTSSFPKQTASTGHWFGGESSHGTTVTQKGQKGNGASTWNLLFQPADTSITPATASYTSRKVRCDKAVPGLTTLGCIRPGYTPTITYFASAYPDVARHIKAAQGSGLPGGYASGTPLTRLTGAKIKKNRKRACPSSLTRPAGKTCDEYPFASSNQGAVTGGGGPRTFGWCSVPGASHSGPTGYSRCMINSTQNSGAGSDLGTFLKANRIISGDKYWVNVS